MWSVVCDDIACHGFLLSKGVLTTFDYPGASDTYAASINEFGTIVGTGIFTTPRATFSMNKDLPIKKATLPN